MTDLTVGTTVRVQNPNGGYKGTVAGIEDKMIHVTRKSIYVGGSHTTIVVHVSRVTTCDESLPIAWTGHRMMRPNQEGA